MGNEKFQLHLVPSGILYPDKVSVIGNGVALDPVILLQEIDNLSQKGIDVKNLKISSRAHIVMPYHKKLDSLQENGGRRIGTTRRGIGPLYTDKMSRTGFRVIDLLDKDLFPRRLKAIVEEKNRILEKIYGSPAFVYQELLDEFCYYAERLRPMVTDTSLLVNQVIDEGKKVLFEGAQGTLLDIDHGTYPYVTSSHPVSGGACVGAGVGPTRINRGGRGKPHHQGWRGPFLLNCLMRPELIRQRGDEYGTTRQTAAVWVAGCGYSKIRARINGLTDIAITKLMYWTP